MKPNEPDRSRGGIFVRDRDGKLLEYIPPTPPHDAPAAAIEAATDSTPQTPPERDNAPGEAMPSHAEADSGETSPPRFPRKHPRHKE